MNLEVMMKQILAMFTNGTEQSEFWVGISLGLNDTTALTITIGLDLKKGYESGCGSLFKLFSSKWGKNGNWSFHVVKRWITVTCPHLSKTTVPFEPTAKSGSPSSLRSRDDGLMDMPKNFSPGLTSEATILYTNGNSFILYYSILFGHIRFV